ncbi:MAG: FAD-dependent oxidoreductase [Thermoguttaceae bacterium]|nr:FAD-dependent oxidoreductase [Thermoguttaceae bacterium]
MRKYAAVALLLVTVHWMPCPGAYAGEPAVNESAREIPIAYEVDVAVVGGGTGAVAAAVAAAEAGATVFLAAPYPYLGDDMTATLRLWLQPGERPEHPLTQQIFDDPLEPRASRNAMKFSYEADIPSANQHRDTDPPSRLADGEWGSAARQSVQYDGDVTITADLGRTERIEEARVMVYRRESGNQAGTGFNVESLTVSISDDKQSWRQIGEQQGRPGEGEDFYILSVPVNATARYVRIAAKKPEQFRRILLGEIELLAPDAETEGPSHVMPRPMYVKKTLDEALLAAGVQYLYSCYATDLLRDAQGRPAGVVMANRAGRQAVLAKTIIDATDRAVVARLAGTKFRPYPAGEHTFRYVVIGGEVISADGMSAQVIDPPLGAPNAGGQFPVIEYTIALPMPDASYAAWMAADLKVRTLTYHPDQQWSSDRLFQVPPDAMHGQEPADGPWQGPDKLPMGALRPAGVERLYVLGGCADVPRASAEGLLRPLALMDLGTRVGAAAAEQAASLPKPEGVKLPGKPATSPAARGDVRESLAGVRPIDDRPGLAQDARALPVLGQYDVVVVGGGTAGAPAGIAAARHGAKTLVVEYLSCLGGVGTEGAIANYYWGNRVGFTATVQDNAHSWTIEHRKQWWLHELLDAGGEVWFGTVGCGAFVDDGRVKGAVVATPFGRGVVLAKTVIDATGNSDVAAAAGADTDYTDASEFGMQGTGLPGRRLGGRYNNNDFTIVDETDMVDIWQIFVHSKGKYPDAFDHGRLINTRERRRIVGEATITLLDAVNSRTYPDTVARARSDFDSHGYTIDPYLLVEHPQHRQGLFTDIPYRAMLPKGLEGMLVVGLGISAHRDAVPLLRMQPDIQNGGYAAGAAAAMAARSGSSLRAIDIRTLQQHLVEIGNLPAEVLEHNDSYPMPPEAIAEAVRSIPEGTGAAVVITHREQSLPLVREAYAAAEGDAKVAYGKLLAVLGDATGLDTMLEKLRATPEWDQGWNYRGMGQYGSAYSPLDELIVAIGLTGQRRAVPAILEKVELLSAGSDFSHHRAVGRALELIGDPAAAEPLARLLAKPGMSGRHHPDIATAIEREVPGGTNAEITRRESLRELFVARALYRCGDHEGVGRQVLQDYTLDLRGHLARHAQAVLAEGK